MICVVSLCTSSPFGIRITSETDGTIYTKPNSGNQVALRSTRRSHAICFLCIVVGRDACVLVNERQRPNKTTSSSICSGLRSSTEQLSAAIFHCVAFDGMRSIRFVQCAGHSIDIQWIVCAQFKLISNGKWGMRICWRSGRVFGFLRKTIELKNHSELIVPLYFVKINTILLSLDI